MLKLNKAIYGLKQSPRLWNKELHEALTSYDLVQSSHDPTLYYKVVEGKLCGAVTVHVDDMCVVGESSFVEDFRTKISSRFDIGSDEELHHFLSIQITRDVEARKVYLCQQHYIKELCKEYLLPGFKRTRTPTTLDFKDLKPKTDSEPPSSGPYANLVGALLWVAQCTRPDISFPVGRLSQFLRSPSEKHWIAATKVLAYLGTTSEMKLSLGGPEFSLVGFSDADWAEDRMSRHSTTGYTYMVGCGPISWRSKKQQTISLSSSEAEYKAASDSCREALLLRSVLRELKLRPESAIPLYVDNEGAEALAKNPTHHSRTKHIHTRYHFVRECVQQGNVKIGHVKSSDMLADLLTKPLGKIQLERQRARLGIN